MPSIPATEPDSLRAGDTWRWTKSLADYPPPDWTLKYQFRSPSLPGFEIIAGASGTDHRIDVPAATTAQYAAGRYGYVAWVSSGAEVYTVAYGEMWVDANLRAGTTLAVLDTRTHARRTLDALEAWIERRDATVAEYTIGDKQMRYISISDLLKLRQIYRAEVEAEKLAAKIAAGSKFAGGRIQCRT